MMIELKVWAILLSYAIPMIVSPGPGNTVLAAAGGKFGVRGTLAFWMGFETGNLVLCLLYGMGLSQLIQMHPVVYDLIKWGGTLYILYLAWCFFRASSPTGHHNLKPLSFFDGFAALSLNPKVHSMILVMYSQFLNPALPLGSQVLQIALVFVTVGLACHFLWIYGGKVLFSRIQSPRATQLMGMGFGVCMLAAAAMLFFS
jgi:homoserine/homoserine lactone efflux protein